jgi:hypothetical protein
MKEVAQISSQRRQKLVRALARLIVAGGILTASLVAMLWRASDPLPANAIGGKKLRTATPASVQLTSLADSQKSIVGTWSDDYQGARTLTVRPDGTATMIIEFDGWKARMFTPRLQIETTWAIEAGRFNRVTVGGEPADKVEFVKRRVGDRASDKIVKITADRMILVDQDGETRYEWHRVK